VKQAGSLVAPERLRFDFTHFSQLDQNQLEKIECMVNEQIRANLAVHTEEMESELAMQSGAMALFEEKYGDRVRVVNLEDFSKELCGGTHTERTGDIGVFKIIAETSVASGVRRIEALTGRVAFAYLQDIARSAQALAYLLRSKPEDLPARIQQLLSAQKASEKELEKLKATIAEAKAASGRDNIKQVNGVDVLVEKVTVETPAAMRDLADRFKDKIQSGIVVLGSVSGNKALLIVIVTKDLTKLFHAGRIVKALSALVGGGGGGRPDMAQAGGPQPENLDLALDKAYEIIQELEFSSSR
jgi:alanyl-tRNA synthetase